MLGASWVEYIHDELVQQYWTVTEAIGTKGVKDRNLLESAVVALFRVLLAMISIQLSSIRLQPCSTR